MAAGVIVNAAMGVSANWKNSVEHVRDGEREREKEERADVTHYGGLSEETSG